MRNMYPSKRTLETIQEIAEVAGRAAHRPYLVLRNGYDHPFYYNRAVDYEVHDDERTWLLVVTSDFYEFWPITEVRASYYYEKDTWTSSTRSRESRRKVDITGLL
jgi:hypothetical protein